MIKPIQIDDTNFEDMLREYKNAVPSIYSGWTNFNTSDPAITLLELLVWMRENQMYYLDNITDNEKESLFKLFGINKHMAKCAETTIIPLKSEWQDNAIIKRGTAFYAGAICFEAAEDRVLGLNQIIEIIDADGESFFVINDEKFGQINCQPFGANPHLKTSFYIRLLKPLKAGEEITIYFEIDSISTVKRNPILELGYISVAEISATDCYNDINIEDYTYGFTQSGDIRFCPRTTMEETEVRGELGYYICCSLISGGYEAPPIIRGVTMNLLTLVQKETVCTANDAKFLNSKTFQYKFIASEKQFETGVIDVYVKKANGRYKKAENVIRELDDEKNSYITFSYKNDENNEPLDVYITSVSPSFLHDRIIGEAKGYDRQVFVLPYDFNIAEDIELMTYLESEEEYICWNRVDNLNESNEDDTVFLFDAEQNKICFGDGIHGKMPEGKLFFTKLAFTMGESGNINSGLIEICEDENIKVVYQKKAYGGANPESADDLAKRLYEKQIDIKRAVSREDYVHLVKKTPGLMIEEVDVFNTSSVAGYNQKGIAIVVKPYMVNDNGFGHSTEVFERTYKNNILRFMEDKRMINTKLFVLESKLIPVEVYIDIICCFDENELKSNIEKCINDFFEKRAEKFGGILKRSDIFECISKLGSIKRITRLNLEAYGENAEKLPSGDLKFPVNGMISLGQVYCNINREQ